MKKLKREKVIPEVKVEESNKIVDANGGLDFCQLFQSCKQNCFMHDFICMKSYTFLPDFDWELSQSSNQTT